jgi:hypothetical protein
MNKKANSTGHESIDGPQHNNSDDFNSIPRQKVMKKISELSDMIYQMDLIYIYRIFRWTTAEYMFFSAAS